MTDETLSFPHTKLHQYKEVAQDQAVHPKYILYPPKYEEKKFVIPYQRSVGIRAPDLIENSMRHEPDGSTNIGTLPGGADEESSPEESAAAVGGW